MHPQISKIGYHCRDYFLGQWDRFKDQPWGDLAHSTHLRGQGTWDPEHGERNGVTATLATGIPEGVVRSVNPNYLDPTTVEIAAYEADPDTFVEPHAGRSSAAWGLRVRHQKRPTRRPATLILRFGRLARGSTPGMQVCARNAEYAADSPAATSNESVTVAPGASCASCKLRRSALWVVDVVPSYNAKVVTIPEPGP